jgi:hypothetical protein
MMSESNALALMSRAKVALMKANTLDEIVKIRNSAKAIRSVLKDTLDARDRSLEAGAIELLAEYKAGKLLNTLKAEKAGDETHVSVAQVCRDANINSEVAKFWQRMASAAVTEEDVAKYVEFVQNSADPAILRSGITIQGFRKFLLGEDEAAPKEARHDWAVMLLANGTEDALDAFVEVSLRVATKAKITNLQDARKGILEEGLIPRGKN